MSDALFVFLIVYFAATAVITVTMVGKPRQPLLASTAAVAVIINLLIIGAIVIWGQ